MADSPVGPMIAGHVKLVFMDGTYVDFQKPPDFDLAAYVHGIRSLGFVLTRSFYVPVHMIKLIMDMDGASAIHAAPMPPQNAPTTDKPQ